MLKAALAAQAMGAWIFPVAANDKVPHRLAGQWGQTATNDASRIFTFWTQVDPFANIGIACKPSQLLVVDLDQAKEDWNLKGTEWGYMHATGPRVDGVLLFDEMVYKADDGDGSWDTYSVRTGSGGLHLYYRWPEHWPRISQASPVKGTIDIRGNGGQHGGYVLAAGSRTSAGEYKPDVTGGSNPITLPPEWIRRLVAEKPKPPSTRRPAAPGAVSIFSHHGLVATVQNAAEGNRNNSLVWAARTMCEEGVPEAEAHQILGQAASNAGLGDLEIERTIQSAYRTQRYKDGS